MSPFYRVGIGKTPQPGDTCVVHWAGRTKNYQAKRIDNTSLRDEPYRFVLGAHAAIPAFEEAVAGMRAGGLRRVEVPGERPELSYPRDRRERFESGFRCGGVGFGARRRMRGCNLCRQMRGCAVPPTRPPPPPAARGSRRYRYGPQPKELGGQRALDFVLDNETLAPTNR